MTNASSQNLSWYEQNQQVLMEGIDRIKRALEYFHENQRSLSPEPQNLPPHSSLASLQKQFALSDFALDLILLCVARAIDPTVGKLCGQIRGNPNLNFPTLMLGLAALPGAEFNVLSPQKPLLSWQLITLEPHTILTEAPLKLNHRLLCYLLGEGAIDPALQGFVKSGLTSGSQVSLVESHAVLAEKLTQTWQSDRATQDWPILQLCGADVQTIYQIADAIAQQMGFDLQVLLADALPHDVGELNTLRLTWEREAILGGRILLLDTHELRGENMPRQRAIQQWLESVTTPLILCSEERYSSQRKAIATHSVPSLTYQERKHLWEKHLASVIPHLNGQLDRIAGQFRINASLIQTASQQLLSTRQTEPEIMPQQLWNICRLQARPSLQDLAQYIQPKATWQDLVLPDNLQEILRQITAHLRQKVKVQEEWGFGAKNSRGLGLSALFAGASGTGKTMAAEVLAQELRLDLFRIDLSAVTSKYIGETEKNLQRIFDAAETGGTILLFDEADALFGKRTQVKDSRDRFANLEVSYLLQRMEVYQGLAILTTNLKDSIDQAFLRRIPFVLNFPFPNKEARAEIWRRVFPSQTPTEQLNYERLGQLNIAGGNISSIALNAAVLAADAEESVQMQHIFKATQSEYIKLGRVMVNTETQGWLK